jgi:hypothetical protein
LRPSDGSAFAEAEDGGQVQRVRTGGDGFVELAIDTQSFKGAGQAAPIGYGLRLRDSARAPCSSLSQQGRR